MYVSICQFPLTKQIEFQTFVKKKCNFVLAWALAMLGMTLSKSGRWYTSSTKSVTNVCLWKTIRNKLEFSVDNTFSWRNKFSTGLSDHLQWSDSAVMNGDESLLPTNRTMCLWWIEHCDLLYYIRLFLDNCGILHTNNSTVAEWSIEHFIWHVQVADINVSTKPGFVGDFEVQVDIHFTLNVRIYMDHGTKCTYTLYMYIILCWSIKVGTIILYIYGIISIIIWIITEIEINADKMTSIYYGITWSRYFLVR